MTKKRIGLVVFLALLGACTAFFFVWSSDKSGGITRLVETGPRTSILLFEPLSGELADYGKAAGLGAQFAAEGINSRGGILGKKLRIEPIEVDGEDEVTVESLRKRNPQLILVAAPDELARPVLRAAAEAKIPAFYLIDGPCKTLYGGAAASPYLWGTGLSWQTTVEPFLVFLNDKYVRAEGEFSVFFLSGNDPENGALSKYARSLSEGLAFRTVDDQSFDPRLADYFAPLRNVLSRTPDLLFISNAGAAGNLMLQQAAKLRLSNDMAVAGMNTFQPELVRPLGDATDSAFTVGSYAAGAETAENKAFLEGIRRFAKDPKLNPTATTAAAYNVLMLADAAYRKSGNSDVQKFAEALEKTELPLPAGTLAFNADNHLLMQPMFVMQLKGGEPKILENLGQSVHPKRENCQL